MSDMPDIDVAEVIVKMREVLRWYARTEPVELYTISEIEEYQRRAKEVLKSCEAKELLFEEKIAFIRKVERER